MKKQVRGAAALAGAVPLGLVCAGGAFAGDIDPPAGPVAPTMKTLSEVEPRTPIRASDLPLTISASGSYYLAEDIPAAAGGIDIDADGVTIDLMGFTLGGGAGAGIELNGTQSDITIRNGRVSGWTGIGIDCVLAQQSRFEGLIVANNGTDGLRMGAGSVADGVTAQNNAQQGITGGAVITRCVARNNGTNGIVVSAGADASVCAASSNGGMGFRVNGGAHVHDCVSESNTGDGFGMATFMATGALVEECVSRGNDGSGFFLHEASTLRSSTSIENLGPGVLVGDDGNTVEGNTVRDNVGGLDVDGTGNVVRGNTVVNNGDNYDFAPGNRLELLIGEIPESLDWPCSARLAGSLTGVAGQNGMTVNAHGVTINLAGHELVGVSGSDFGILANASDTTVRNGVLRDWGVDGVAGGTRALIENVAAVDNGSVGINVDHSSIVRSCRTVGNGGQGILIGDACLVESCVSNQNGGRGIWALGDRSAILSCTIERNSGNGIETENECRVHGCTVYGRGAGGSVVCIRVDRSCSVRDNHVTLGPSDTGIEAYSVGSAILDNVISADNNTTGTGIVLDGAAHIVARNEISTFFGMTSISVTGGAHAIGPIVNVSGAGDISTVAGSDHPMANFEY